MCQRINKELTDSGYACAFNNTSIYSIIIMLHLHFFNNWEQYCLIIVPQFNSSGILTLEVVAVDAFNNTRTDLLDFNYHNAASLFLLYTKTITLQTTNGTILLNYSSQFDTIISTDGDYSQVSYDSDGYLYFSSPGVHTFNCSLVDESHAISIFKLYPL